MTLAARSAGTGTPVVCLPWFGLDGSVTAAALEPALSDWPGLERRYVDLPGTGGSPAGALTSDGVLDAVEEYVAETVGERRFLLTGCSYGGYLAAALARRRPHQVAGLLLIVAGVRIRPADRDLSGVVPAQRREWLAGVGPQWREHLTVALGNRTAAAAEQVAGLLTAAPPGDDDYLGRLRSTGYRLTDEDSPARFAGPTMIVAGRGDGIAGFADQFSALARYPAGTYAVLADAGHYLPFEQPSAFAALVRQWLVAAAARP
ncbi:MAG TPA: alpha/beta hydrolase [Jiangellaceae bacterium]